jgi:ATP adenylyltransferase
MDSLFAPWRMQWVTRDRPDKDESDECIFCRLESERDDRQNNIIARSNHSYILLNNMPYNPGHVMIIPYNHTGAFSDLDEEILVDLMRNTQVMINGIKKGLSPQGFNLGMNIGPASGASITNHLHMHIIPRWRNDTTFMPLTANTSIVEEAVDETYTRLRTELLESTQITSRSGSESVQIRY